MSRRRCATWPRMASRSSAGGSTTSTGIAPRRSSTGGIATSSTCSPGPRPGKTTPAFRRKACAGSTSYPGGMTESRMPRSPTWRRTNWPALRDWWRRTDRHLAGTPGKLPMTPTARCRGVCRPERRASQPLAPGGQPSALAQPIGVACRKQDACIDPSAPLCGAAKVAERPPPMALDIPHESLSPSGASLLASRVEEALAFDDVLVVPSYSQVLPSSTSTITRLTRTISLNIPLISAAMDTVTEYEMAIAMAQLGGMGVIHKNLSAEEQAANVRRVKKYESGMVVNPLTIHPDQTLGDVKALKASQHISGIPVVERDTNRLVGIITNRDVRFASDPSLKVYELMTRENLVTVTADVGA